MTFSEFLHLLTTSRYTRRLEADNDELRKQVKELKTENAALIFALGRPRAVENDAETDSAGVTAAQPLRRRRPGKWQGFSQIKRELESQEPPNHPKGA
jgi:hypothetical protein